MGHLHLTVVKLLIILHATNVWGIYVKIESNPQDEYRYERRNAYSIITDDTPDEDGDLKFYIHKPVPFYSKFVDNLLSFFYSHEYPPQRFINSKKVKKRKDYIAEIVLGPSNNGPDQESVTPAGGN